MTKNEIIICKACNNRERVLGAELARNLINGLGDLDTDTKVKTVSCMGACNSFCVMAFKSEGKPTYIFGKLLPENTAEIITLFKVYIQADDGKLPWEARPQCLRNLIAVIPSTID